MRIALIADTHGTLDARIEAAIAGFDLIVHAGDVGGDVAGRLAALARDVVIVRGNNDLEDAPWPKERRLDLPGGPLVVTHGDRWPAKVRHERLRRTYPDARAVVCGHSHRRWCDQSEIPWILNPGAAGRMRAYGGPGWLELSVSERDWQVQTHDYEPAPRQLRG